MRIHSSCVVMTAFLCTPALAQVQLMGKVWIPKSPELADRIPPSTGLHEDYFAPKHPADPVEVLALANVRCFASLEGSHSEAMSHTTWSTAPVGWYRLAGSEGRYALLFTGPSVFLRPTIFTNIYAFQHDVVDRKVVPGSSYADFHTGQWDEKAASAYYQTFVAKGTSVTNMGFKVVHDGIDGIGPGSQTILASIHRKGPGTPDTWEQVGPTVPVPNVDSGGAKNYEWSAAWNSGEVPTAPGETYAVCLKVEQPGNGFQIFWRSDENREEDCFRVGKDGQSGFTGHDLWMYIAGDGDGLLIPYNKHIQKEFREFAGFARRWCQTYVAQGRGLAGVVMYAGTGGSQPGIHRQRAAVRVREGGPDGPVIGIEKIAIGEGIHTGDASWGTFGAVFSPGEVTLTPGQTYALEFETIENYASLHGYVNIKGVVSDENAGFNPYHQQPGESYEHGTAYKDGQDVGFDIDMQIIEYAHAVDNWAQAVDARNLLTNSDMEAGDLSKDDSDVGTPEGWKTFAVDPGTVHRYLADGPKQGNRILRVLGGSVTQKTVDGGFVQKVIGLNHLDTYRITGQVRCSWPVDADHVCYVGVDATGQDADPKADSIKWTAFPLIHSIFVPFDSGPVRAQSGAISVWLRGWTRSVAGYPFRADFDNFALRRVNTGVPVAPQSSQEPAIEECKRTHESAAPWRDLADYPRPTAPDTGWGIHDHTNGWWKPPDQDKFFKEMKTRWGFSWWKMLTLGANKLDMTAAARRQGVEPVIRIYDLREYPQPGKEMEEYRKLIRDYVKAGARYFELANEPNIDGDWTAGGTVQGNRVEGMCETWLRLKPIVMEEGGIPIFYAMTPGSAGQYYADCFETFKKWGKIEEAFAGAAIGIHPYPLNHPLDYPFDAKKNMPHATSEERFQSLINDNTCFLVLELVQHLQRKYLPHPIPILATESGVSYGDQADQNYPKITMDMHRNLNMEIFNRMNPRHPKYWGDTFFSNMVWAYGGQGSFMFSGWFNNPEFGDLPVLGDMEKAEKFDRGIALKSTHRIHSDQARKVEP